MFAICSGILEVRDDSIIRETSGTRMVTSTENSAQINQVKTRWKQLPCFIILLQPICQNSWIGGLHKWSWRAETSSK